MICKGQSLFFDNLENFAWTSTTPLKDVIHEKTIELSKLEELVDSIKTDCTIWTFKDSLTVIYYNAS